MAIMEPNALAVLCPTLRKNAHVHVQNAGSACFTSIRGARALVEPSFDGLCADYNAV